MIQNKELEKWNILFQKNKHIKNLLKKIEKLDISKTNFFNDLKVCDHAIFGKYDVGYGSVNAITIKKIIEIFCEIIDYKNNNYFLISSDGSEENTKIIDDVLHLGNRNIKFITFAKYQGYDKKFISSIIKKIKPAGAIHISKSIFQKNLININLYGQNGNKITNIILEGIIKQIDKNVDNVIYEKEKNISFLNNNLLIKLFVEKISELFPKSNSIKKTKIAISNRSKGITKILSKLIGSQDFSYTINDKIKNNNISILDTKYLSDTKIKRYFKKDIKFAKQRKANFLIAFNQEGTQSFLFIINNSKVIYLNPNLIAMIFLHDFYNSLALTNKNLPNVFISSNENLNPNLEKIVKKYKIYFKKIRDNEFISKDYLLLFWNDYNQFVFGEKVNEEFTIYHLLIKIISIVDYYNNQYNSINALTNKLIRMYDDFEKEFRYFISNDINDFNKKIEYKFKETKNKKRIEELKKIELVENEDIEQELWQISLKNNSRIFIKYNRISQKIHISLKNTKTHNIIKDIFIHYENKKIIRKILK